MIEQGVIRKIDWTIKPAKMRSIADEDLERAKRKLDNIAKTPSTEVSLQTLKDFEEVLGSAADHLGYLIFIKDVSVNKD